MKKRILIAAVVLMSLIQLAIPIQMIWQRSDILRTGEEYRFKVQPIDPYDALRGRYLTIHVDSTQAEKMPYTNVNRKEYAILERDSEGFASVSKSSLQKPQEIIPYIVAKRKYGNLILPFDRYYVNEKLAPLAEKAYTAERKDAYIKVRIKNGHSVIEGLYLDGQRIEDYVKETLK